METLTTTEQIKSNSTVNPNKVKQQFFFSPINVQPKLSIGAPDDPYEREADAMAERVMRMQASENNPTFFKPLSVPSIQAKCAGCEEEEKLRRKETSVAEIDAGTSLEAYTNSLQGNGRPLPDTGRRFFESRFGHSFSDVRIHTGIEAAQSAQSINALAYTTGNNIVFNQNQFSPDTDTGKRLLAHELTHVVQQGITVKKTIQRDLAIEPANPEVEEPVLTARQIRDAIIFNSQRYNEDNIRLIQGIVGGPVTGTLTEETIRLIALYQAQNGLTPDGMVGTNTFDQLAAEQEAEGASPDTCLTMFNVALVTPMELHSAGAGLANIFGHFDVEIRFAPHCDCSRFQYRQFISGLVTRNGINMNNQFSIPGPGGLPAISNWVEDGNTTLPHNGRYGHRSHPANAGGLPNQYVDAEGNVDMLNGCKFQSFDEPGVLGAPANSGDVWAFDFRFYGEIQRDGQMVERKFWSVRERVVIP